MRISFLFIFATMVLAAAVLSALPAKATGVSVEGTELVVRLADGRALRSHEIVGAMLFIDVDGKPTRIRLTAVERDPADKTGSVWLHDVEYRQPDGSWVNSCQPGTDGRRLAFPLIKADGSMEMICASGTLCTCVRLGYRPWAGMGELHAACVRMMRADYGGSDHPWTRNGMRIDVYDERGVQKPDNAIEDAFEAGWTPDGAVCVRHVRVKDVVTLAELEKKFPLLRGRTGDICTEAFARLRGAVLFNRSKP